MRKLKAGDKVLIKNNKFYAMTIITVLENQKKDLKDILVKTNISKGRFPMRDLILAESKAGIKRIALIQEIQILEDAVSRKKEELFRKK